MSFALSSMPHFEGNHRLDRPTFKFRFAPAPLEFEPAYGWARRAASENGQPDMRILSTQLGVAYTRFDSQYCLSVAHASDAPDLDVLTLNTPIANKARNTISVRGEEFALGAWSVRTRRHCPACLAESPHHRFFWDLSFFRTCPYHGCCLEGGDDGRKVLWSHSDLRLSGQGEWLPRSQPRLEIPALGLERYVLGRFGILPPIPCPLLDAHPLDEVDWAVRAIGLMRARPGYMSPRPKSKLPTDADILLAGFEVMAGDRHHLLEAVRTSAKAVLSGLVPLAEAGMSKLFGRAYRVSSCSGFPLAATILDAMTEVTLQCGRSRRIGLSPWRARNPSTFVIGEIATELGIPWKAVTSVIELSGIDIASRTGAVRFFGPEDVELLRKVREDALSPKQAGEVLGLRPRDLVRLEKAGAIRHVWLNRGTGGKKFYCKADIDPALGSKSHKIGGSFPATNPRVSREFGQWVSRTI